MYLRPFVVGCKCGDVALDLKYIISQTIKEKKNCNTLQDR